MRCLKHFLYGRKWWRFRQGGRLKYSDLTMVQNIEMINFRYSVRRKTYLGTLQLEIHLAGESSVYVVQCWFGQTVLAEAVMYVSHLINRLPSTALNRKTPLEVWSGKPINDYDTLHVFGSIAYYHVKESKLDQRAKKALFMGVTSGVKGYRLWCLSLKKITSSRDVTFDESAMLKKVTTDGKVSENTFQQPEGRLPQVEGTQKLVEFQTTSVKPVED